MQKYRKYRSIKKKIGLPFAVLATSAMIVSTIIIDNKSIEDSYTNLMNQKARLQEEKRAQNKLATQSQGKIDTYDAIRNLDSKLNNLIFTNNIENNLSYIKNFENKSSSTTDWSFKPSDSNYEYGPSSQTTKEILWEEFSATKGKNYPKFVGIPTDEATVSSLKNQIFQNPEITHNNFVSKTITTKFISKPDFNLKNQIKHSKEIDLSKYFPWEENRFERSWGFTDPEGEAFKIEAKKTLSNGDVITDSRPGIMFGEYYEDYEGLNVPSFSETEVFKNGIIESFKNSYNYLPWSKYIRYKLSSNTEYLIKKENKWGWIWKGFWNYYKRSSLYQPSQLNYQETITDIKINGQKYDSNKRRIKIDKIPNWEDFFVFKNDNYANGDKSWDSLNLPGIQLDWNYALISALKALAELPSNIKQIQPILKSSLNSAAKVKSFNEFKNKLNNADFNSLSFNSILNTIWDNTLGLAYNTNEINQIISALKNSNYSQLNKFLTYNDFFSQTLQKFNIAKPNINATNNFSIPSEIVNLVQTELNPWNYYYDLIFPLIKQQEINAAVFDNFPNSGYRRILYDGKGNFTKVKISSNQKNDNVSFLVIDDLILEDRKKILGNTRFKADENRIINNSNMFNYSSQTNSINNELTKDNVLYEKDVDVSSDTIDSNKTKKSAIWSEYYYSSSLIELDLTSRTTYLNKPNVAGGSSPFILAHNEFIDNIYGSGTSNKSYVSDLIEPKINKLENAQILSRWTVLQPFVSNSVLQSVKDAKDNSAKSIILDKYLEDAEIINTSWFETKFFSQSYINQHPNWKEEKISLINENDINSALGSEIHKFYVRLWKNFFKVVKPFGITNNKIVKFKNFLPNDFTGKFYSIQRAKLNLNFDEANLANFNYYSIGNTFKMNTNNDNMWTSRDFVAEIGISKKKYTIDALDNPNSSLFDLFITNSNNLKTNWTQSSNNLTKLTRANFKKWANFLAKTAKNNAIFNLTKNGFSILEQNTILTNNIGISYQEAATNNSNSNNLNLFNNLINSYGQFILEFNQNITSLNNAANSPFQPQDLDNWNSIVAKTKDNIKLLIDRYKDSYLKNINLTDLFEIDPKNNRKIKISAQIIALAQNKYLEPLNMEAINWYASDSNKIANLESLYFGYTKQGSVNWDKFISALNYSNKRDNLKNDSTSFDINRFWYPNATKNTTNLQLKEVDLRKEFNKAFSQSLFISKGYNGKRKNWLDFNFKYNDTNSKLQLIISLKKDLGIDQDWVFNFRPYTINFPLLYQIGFDANQVFKTSDQLKDLFQYGYKTEYSNLNDLKIKFENNKDLLLRTLFKDDSEFSEETKALLFPGLTITDYKKEISKSLNIAINITNDNKGLELSFSLSENIPNLSIAKTYLKTILANSSSLVVKNILEYKKSAANKIYIDRIFKNPLIDASDQSNYFNFAMKLYDNFISNDINSITNLLTKQTLNIKAYFLGIDNSIEFPYIKNIEFYFSNTELNPLKWNLEAKIIYKDQKDLNLLNNIKFISPILSAARFLKDLKNNLKTELNPYLVAVQSIIRDKQFAKDYLSFGYQKNSDTTWSWNDLIQKLENNKKDISQIMGNSFIANNVEIKTSIFQKMLELVYQKKQTAKQSISFFWELNQDKLKGYYRAKIGNNKIIFANNLDLWTVDLEKTYMFDIAEFEPNKLFYGYDQENAWNFESWDEMISAIQGPNTKNNFIKRFFKFTNSQRLDELLNIIDQIVVLQNDLVNRSLTLKFILKQNYSKINKTPIVLKKGLTNDCLTINITNIIHYQKSAIDGFSFEKILANRNWLIALAQAENKANYLNTFTKEQKISFLNINQLSTNFNPDTIDKIDFKLAKNNKLIVDVQFKINPANQFCLSKIALKNLEFDLIEINKYIKNALNSEIIKALDEIILDPKMFQFGFSQENKTNLSFKDLKAQILAKNLEMIINPELAQQISAMNDLVNNQIKISWILDENQLSAKLILESELFKKEYDAKMHKTYAFSVADLQKDYIFFGYLQKSDQILDFDNLVSNLGKTNYIKYFFKDEVEPFIPSLIQEIKILKTNKADKSISLEFILRKHYFLTTPNGSDYEQKNSSIVKYNQSDNLIVELKNIREFIKADIRGLKLENVDQDILEHVYKLETMDEKLSYLNNLLLEQKLMFIEKNSDLIHRIKANKSEIKNLYFYSENNTDLEAKVEFKTPNLILSTSAEKAMRIDNFSSKLQNLLGITNSNNSTGANSANMKSWAIGGGVAASIILIATASFFIIWKIRHKNNLKQNEENQIYANASAMSISSTDSNKITNELKAEAKSDFAISTSPNNCDSKFLETKEILVEISLDNFVQANKSENNLKTKEDNSTKSKQISKEDNSTNSKQTSKREQKEFVIEI